MKVSLELQARGIPEYTRGMRDAESATGRLGGSMDRMGSSSRAMESSLRTVGTLLPSLGLAALATESIQYADSQTLIANRLKLVTGSTRELVSVESQLYSISQDTRQAHTLTADLYARMARSTQELGTSQRDLLRVTETVNKSIAISGGSAESTNAAIIQLGQGMASGTLRGEELNSVMEQTPRLAEAIANGLGVGIGQLRKMGEEGELTSEKVVSALLSQSDAIDREYGKMVPTVSQAMTTLNNAVGRYIGGADRAASATARMASGITTVADHFDDLGDAAIAVSTVIAGRFVASLTAAGIASAAKTAKMVAEWRAVSLAAAAANRDVLIYGSSVTTAARAASGATGIISILGGPIGIVTGLLTAGATAWYIWGRNADEAAKKARNASAMLPAHNAPLNQSISTTGGLGTFTPAGAKERWASTYSSQLDGIFNKPKTDASSGGGAGGDDSTATTKTYERYNEYVREHNGLVDDQRKLLEEIDTLRRGGTVNLEKEYREMNRINAQVYDFVSAHKEYEKPLVNSVQRYAEILDYLVKANEELRTRNQLEAEVPVAQAGFDFNARASQGFLNYRAADGYGSASLLPPELQRQQKSPYSLLNPTESRGAEPTATDPGAYRQYISEFGTDQEKSFQGTVDRVDSLGAYLEQGVISHQEYFAKVEALYEEHNNRVSEFDRMKAENALMTSANMMDGLAATLMQGSKKQFEIGKSLAITSAIIETMLGAQNAFTAMSSIPIVGPALGAAAAGAAIAMGMARVSMISSQQYTPGRALGGNVEPGYAYEVGERGREVFVPWQRGQIIPNSQVPADNYNRRGDKVIRITNNFNVGENTDRRSRQQIANEAGASIARAMRRLN